MGVLFSQVGFKKKIDPVSFFFGLATPLDYLILDLYNLGKPPWELRRKVKLACNVYSGSLFQRRVEGQSPKWVQMGQINK